MKKQIYETIDSKLLLSFQIIKKVGQGAYGQVWKVKNKRTGAICALKKIYEAFRNPSDSQKSYRQIRYLQKLDHPNIVKLYCYHKALNYKDIYLELQFLEADLSIALKNSVLQEIHKHYIFYQIANALNYLHAAELVHRDVKPSNVLLNEACDVKLCDFGLVRSLKKDKPNDQLLMTENVATRWYRAPQILLATNTYGKAVDIWSLGCVLAEMFLEKPLFQGNSTISQLQKIFQITGKPCQQDLYFVKKQVSLKIVQSMKVSKKKSIKDIFPNQDKNMIDLLQKIFQINPNKRPTAQEILNHPFVSRFRGRVQQKLPSETIKILYDSKMLKNQDYRSILYGQTMQGSLKRNESPSYSPNMFRTVHNIRPTLPNNHSPFGKLPNKSPSRVSNLNNKTTTPFVDVTKNQNVNTLMSQDIKQEKHRPMFLQMRKKENQQQTKPTREKTPSRLQTEPITQSHLNENSRKNIFFPSKISPPKDSPPKESPKKDTPFKRISPFNKFPKEKNTHRLWIKNQKFNPESPSNKDKKGHELSQLKYFPAKTMPIQNTEILQNSLEGMTINECTKISKERMPKFMLEPDRRLRQKTPRKWQQEKSRYVNPLKERSISLAPLPKIMPSEFEKMSTIQVQTPTANARSQHQFSSIYTKLLK